jgi:hypothetical protein
VNSPLAWPLLITGGVVLGLVYLHHVENAPAALPTAQRPGDLPMPTGMPAGTTINPDGTIHAATAEDLVKALDAQIQQGRG